jgi:hypothetical protein
MHLIRENRVFPQHFYFIVWRKKPVLDHDSTKNLHGLGSEFKHVSFFVRADYNGMAATSECILSPPHGSSTWLVSVWTPEFKIYDLSKDR